MINAWTGSIKFLPPEKFKALLKDRDKLFANGPCPPCKGKCCTYCASNLGYLTGLSPDKFKGLKKQFWVSDEKGFQGKTGCNLPVEERSGVCITFACDKVMRQSEDETRYTRDKRYKLYRKMYDTVTLTK